MNFIEQIRGEEGVLSDVEEIKKALNDYGYPSKAIREIMKWYELLGKVKRGSWLIRGGWKNSRKQRPPMHNGGDTRDSHEWRTENLDHVQSKLKL